MRISPINANTFIFSSNTFGRGPSRSCGGGLGAESLKSVENGCYE